MFGIEKIFRRWLVLEFSVCSQLQSCWCRVWIWVGGRGLPTGVNRVPILNICFTQEFFWLSCRAYLIDDCSKSGSS